MNIVQVRSPFKIVINETGQLNTQVKLYIWNKGDTEPTEPTYTLSKAIPDLVNIECVYNISNYLQEFIDPIGANNSNLLDEEYNKGWCLFKVERYTDADDTELYLLDTVYYVGLNGFTEYTDGNQVAEIADFKFMNLLSNINIIKNGDNSYFNVLIQSEASPTNILTVNYNNGIDNSTWSLNNIGDEIVLWKIPYVNYDLSNPYLSCKLDFYLGDERINRILTNATEECLYTPVQCDFQNSKGGWETIIFFKAQTNTINIKGSEFNLLPNATDYDPYRGQSKVFNLNGNQTIKVNTGWVEEITNIVMHDLLLSETILLDNKPVKLKTKSLTYKTNLKDKNINYEMEFDYSFDLINNVV